VPYVLPLYRWINGGKHLPPSKSLRYDEIFPYQKERIAPNAEESSKISPPPIPESGVYDYHSPLRMEKPPAMDGGLLLLSADVSKTKRFGMLAMVATYDHELGRRYNRLKRVGPRDEIMQFPVFHDFVVCRCCCEVLEFCI
jgi:hypothetical protein